MECSSGYEIINNTCSRLCNSFDNTKNIAFYTNNELFCDCPTIKPDEILDEN